MRRVGPPKLLQVVAPSIRFPRSAGGGVGPRHIEANSEGRNDGGEDELETD